MVATGRLVLAILRSRGLILLSILGICLAAAITYGLLASDRYRAVAMLLIEPSPVDSLGPSDALTTARASDLDLLRSERVAQRVVENESLMQAPSLRRVYLESIDSGRQPLEAMAQYLSEHVRAAAESVGGLVRLTVTMEDPQLAARVANAYAQAWGELILELRAASIRNGVERAHQDLALLRVRLSQAHAQHREDGALTAASFRADEQFAQLSRIASQSLQSTVASPATSSSGSTPWASADWARGASDVSRVGIGARFEPAVPASVEPYPVWQPAQASAARLTELPPSAMQAGTQASAEDEMRLAQQSLERAEQRLAQLSAEGIGAPFPTHVLGPARVPEASIKPDFLACVAMGLAFGFALGALLVAVAEKLDRRVRRASDLTHGAGVVVLGDIPSARASRAAIAGPARGASDWLRLRRVSTLGTS